MIIELAWSSRVRYNVGYRKTPVRIILKLNAWTCVERNIDRDGQYEFSDCELYFISIKLSNK